MDYHFTTSFMSFHSLRIDLASIRTGQTIKEQARCIFVGLADEVSVPQNHVAPFPPTSNLLLPERNQHKTCLD